MALSIKDIKNITFGIIGLGLIGGSYAKALKNLGVKNIIGVDTNKIVALMALDEGFITEACFTEPLDALKKCDVIISTLYPGVLVDFVKKNQKYFKDEVLFTDVTGIKGNLLTKVDKALAGKGDFVAGHPMAGREGKGYGQSAAEIFNGANYIVIDRGNNKKENVQWLKEFAYLLGCKNVVEITPKEHDEIIAYTSNLPHAMAVCLINSDSMTKNTKYFIAGSFRDATRVADINEILWADLFLFNKDNVIGEIDKLEEQLEMWKAALAKEDKTKLIDMMEKAKAKRKDLFNAKNYR